MSAASDRFVYLKGELTVPVEPLLLIFALQERGFTLTPEGDNVLVVQPSRGSRRRTAGRFAAGSATSWRCWPTKRRRLGRRF